MKNEIVKDKVVIEKVKDSDVVISDMYNEISNIILNNKNKMIYQINNTLVKLTL